LGTLREFYQALLNGNKRCFLHILHAILEHPVFEMVHLQSTMTTMADSTDICENAIKATVHLAGYPMSDLYSYLEEACLVVPPLVLQIGVANAQLRAMRSKETARADHLSRGT